MERSWLQNQWDAIVFEYFGEDKFNTIVWGTFLWFFILYWVIGGLFTFVDLTGKPNFMKKYKIQENIKSYPITKTAFLDLVTVVLTNQVILFPCLVLAYHVDKWRPILNIHTLPTLTETIFHILFFIFVIEVMFYYAHRILHYPPLYKRIHKKHHTWVSPVAIAAIYCHPLEQIVSNIIPTIAGSYLLCSHVLVLWIWMFISILTTLVTHSGYHLPFLPSAEAHDFHHLKFNYNFGVVGFLDWVHGTDGLFQKSKEAVRHKTLWTLVPAKKLFP